MHIAITRDQRIFATLQRAARTYGVLMLLLLLTMVWPHRTRSQTSTASATPQPPQQIVYKQVFRTVALLDIEADLADQQGGNGSALRNFYQNKAGLTAAEAALLKTTSHNTVVALEAIDQQIQAGVAAYRVQLKNKLSSAPTPAIPSDLQILQAQKDALVLNALSTIQSGFGEARFQNLDKFVQANIVPNITTGGNAAAAAKKQQPIPPSRSASLPPMQSVLWK